MARGLSGLPSIGPGSAVAAIMAAVIVGAGRYRGGVEVDTEFMASLRGEQRLDASDLQQLGELYHQARSDSSDFIWLAVANPVRREVEALGDTFSISRLWTDDALNPSQRAKFEIAADGGAALVVFKLIEYVERSSDIETGQLTMFVGDSFLLTVRWGARGGLGAVRTALTGKPDLLCHGPLAAAHALADAVVDDYLLAADELDKDIDSLEEAVFSPAISDDTGAIYRLKRENLELRRAVTPLVPLAQSLTGRRYGRVPDGISAHLSDVGDHLLRVGDSVDSRDSLLLAMLSASNARQALQQNIDMRKIAAYAAILAFPTAIAGIYGMNFDFMPELHHRAGYPVVLAVMILGMTVIFRAFKRSGWL